MIFTFCLKRSFGADKAIEICLLFTISKYLNNKAMNKIFNQYCQNLKD